MQPQPTRSHAVRDCPSIACPALDCPPVPQPRSLAHRRDLLGRHLRGRDDGENTLEAGAEQSA